MPTRHPVRRLSACPVCRGARSELFCTARDRLDPAGSREWRIRRCLDCGLGWTEPVLTPEEVAAYYPGNYLGDTERTIEAFLSGRLVHSRSWRQETEKVRLVEQVVSGGRILDVGCGDGKFLWALDPKRWHRSGIEFSQAVVGLVNARIPGIQLIEGSIDSPLLDPGSFDVITFWHVFEHLHEPDRVLQRIRDLLKPEGRLFISLPNLDSLQAGWFRQHWFAFGDVPRHVFHYSPPPLERLLEQAGYRLEGQRFFSRTVSFHCLKHSVVHWSEERFGNRLPYYTLKPALLLFPLLEMTTGKYAILTMIARKAASRRPN